MVDIICAFMPPVVCLLYVMEPVVNVTRYVAITGFEAKLHPNCTTVTTERTKRWVQFPSRTSSVRNHDFLPLPCYILVFSQEGSRRRRRRRRSGQRGHCFLFIRSNQHRSHLSDHDQHRRRKCGHRGMLRHGYVRSGSVRLDCVNLRA